MFAVVGAPLVWSLQRWLSPSLRQVATHYAQQQTCGPLASSSWTCCACPHAHDELLSSEAFQAGLVTGSADPRKVPGLKTHLEYSASLAGMETEYAAEVGLDECFIAFSSQTCIYILQDWINDVV